MRCYRAISNVLAALILIAIVAFAGIMLFFMTGGFFQGGGRASIILTATGTGSTDGSMATINLMIQNTGDGAARIIGIYVAPESAGVNATGLKIPNFELAKSGVLSRGGLPQIPTKTDTGEVVDAKMSRQVFIRVTGEELYSGAQLRVYVAYVDLGSGETGIVDTVVTLR